MGEIVYCDADSNLLREKIYRFRYDVYVSQMRRRQLYADHDRKIICEPMDDEGQNFAALKDGEVVATIRSNCAIDASCKYYSSFYKTSDFAPTPLERIQFTTKFMVRQDLRGSSIGPKLLIYYARRTHERGFHIDVMDCNKHLIQFFERCGYFSYLGWKFHKEFGTVRPMFAPLDAGRYLSEIGSVLRQNEIRENEYGGVDHVKRIAQTPTDAAVATKFSSHFG